VGEVDQVRAFGVVELQGAGDRVEHAGRHSGQGAAFELRVVLDAHAGQYGDLGAAQAGDAAVGAGGQARLLGCDLGAPRDEELADLGAIVHGFDRTSRRSAVGCPAGTPISRNSLPRRE
jgi:hypothetical protein